MRWRSRMLRSQKRNLDALALKSPQKTKELYYALLGLEARKRASLASTIAAEERLKERKDETETGTILEVRAMQAKAALLESKQAALTIDIPDR